MSLTVTLKLHTLLIFPAASVAVYVIAVVPTGKEEPGVCDLVQIKLFAGVQLSVAVGSVQDTVVVHNPASLVLVMLLGQPAITGFCVSVTVTVNEHVLLTLFDASLQV